jgi:DnaJ domain
MSELTRFPLVWPPGWRRTSPEQRTGAKFYKPRKTKTADGTGQTVELDRVSVSEGLRRVLHELELFGIELGDVLVSTNIPTRQDGMPRGDRGEPRDPGVAIYWHTAASRRITGPSPKAAPRCMAIDLYDRVADNLAAIAATLEAMRTIGRHGGALILDRAFTGFTALPAPEQWFQVLGVPAQASADEIRDAHARLAAQHHPDRAGGNTDKMARINVARDEGLANARP